MSEDPIGFAAGDANLMRYVGGMPTTYIDPWGLHEALGPPVFPPTSSDDALSAISHLSPDADYGTDMCQSFANNALNGIKNLNHPGINNAQVVTFALFPNDDAPWMVQLTLTTGHAAVLITLEDGRQVYFDNGAFGGDDGLFQIGDIPSFAYPGTPSLGICESFGKYWNEAYPPTIPPGRSGIFNPYYGP